MTQKKIALAIGSILVLVVAGVLVWRMKENQEELKPSFQKPVQSALEQSKETSTDIVARNLDISKWKTYRNEEYGFEFQYPEEMFEIFLGENEVFPDSDAPKAFSLSLNLFFNVNNNTVRTPILDISFNELENDYVALMNADAKCTEVLVGNRKGNLCGHKTVFNEVLRNYESFKSRGICSDDSIGSLVIELASRNIGQKKYTDGVSINLQCDHKESLGSIYRSIYESLHFF